jgi:hypothetical protein
MKNEDKQAFIAALEHALQMYTREQVAALRYYVDNVGRELVQIEYESGAKEYADITGDSCLAIMHDLYKALL